MAVARQMQVPHGRSTASAQVIPAFGDWDSYYYGGEGNAGLPITQYFESARAAGLSRRQQQPYPSIPNDPYGYMCCHDGHGHGHHLPPYLRSYHHQYCNQKRMMVMRNPDSHEDLWWEKRRQSEEGPLMVMQRPQGHHSKYEQQPAAAAARKQPASMTGRTPTRLTPVVAKKKMAAARPAVHRAPKAVDEDLYKIPPELLRLHQRATSRRRSILRSWRCIGIHCLD